MSRLLPVLLLALAACGGAPRPVASPAPEQPPVAAAERAEEALRTAYAHADAAPLKGLFEGRALITARRQLAELARRGVHREEVIEVRRDVHESVAGDHAEVVLQVRGRQRLLMAGKPAAAYSSFLRQWRATLARRGAGLGGDRRRRPAAAAVVAGPVSRRRRHPATRRRTSPRSRARTSGGPPGASA